MSTGNLNIWVLKSEGNRCLIEDKIPHYVYIVDCEGNPLVWCGKTYVALEMKCGHLELTVPPGCYFVGAVRNPFSAVDPKYRPFGNHLSHLSMVRINCGDHACVTLFDPTFHHCGTWFETALVRNLGGGVVAGELGAAMKEARPVLRRLVAALEKEDPDTFAQNVAKALETRKQPGVRATKKR
jgi:hypothetical protein